MDKAVYKEKIDSMMPDLIEGIRKECDRLIQTGAVDVEQYGNDYALPKICLTVAIENQIRQYRPLDKNHLKEVANLRHF